MLAAAAASCSAWTTHYLNLLSHSSDPKTLLSCRMCSAAANSCCKDTPFCRLQSMAAVATTISSLLSAAISRIFSGPNELHLLDSYHSDGSKSNPDSDVDDSRFDTSPCNHPDTFTLDRSVVETLNVAKRRSLLLRSKTGTARWRTAPRIITPYPTSNHQLVVANYYFQVGKKEQLSSQQLRRHARPSDAMRRRWAEGGILFEPQVTQSLRPTEDKMNFEDGRDNQQKSKEVDNDDDAEELVDSMTKNCRISDQREKVGSHRAVLMDRNKTTRSSTKNQKFCDSPNYRLRKLEKWHHPEEPDQRIEHLCNQIGVLEDRNKGSRMRHPTSAEKDFWRATRLHELMTIPTSTKCDWQPATPEMRNKKRVRFADESLVRPACGLTTLPEQDELLERLMGFESCCPQSDNEKLILRVIKIGGHKKRICCP